MKKLLIAILLTCAATLRAELIPANNITDWSVGTRSGVIGGIPTGQTIFADVTQPPYSANNSGSADATSAIQDAIDDCPDNQVVYLPAGTYNVNTLGIPNRTILRGAGVDVTRLEFQGGASAIFMGTDANYLWNEPAPNGMLITAGAHTKDSTVLTMADTSAFAVGELAHIYWSNMTDDAALTSGAMVVVNTGGMQLSDVRTWARQQKVKVVSKTATTLTIFPGIYHAGQAGTTARIAAGSVHADFSGVEDLTVDGNGLPIYGVRISQGINCWVKNVKSIAAANYPFFLEDSLNCEMRHCYAQGGTGGGTNGAGFLVNSVSGSLIEDNIIFEVFPAFEINEGSCGNVVAYNFSDTNNSSIQVNLNTNHGPHNSHNLVEGNIVPSLNSDGYFGSASETLIFRNWLMASNASKTIQLYVVGLNRFTRKYAMIGNLVANDSWPSGAYPYSFGNPNIGNGDFTGTSKISAGDFPVDWKATATLTSGGGTSAGVMTMNSGDPHTGQHFIKIYWNSDTQSAELLSDGVSTPAVSGSTVTFAIGGTLPTNGTVFNVWTGAEGFQEQDQDCFSEQNGGTTILKANYNFTPVAVGIPANEGLGGDTLPDSFYRSSKPTFFGNLTWPAHNPLAPGSLTHAQRVQTIPAGYRYINGVDPPPDGGGGGSIIQTLNVTNLRVSP